MAKKVGIAEQREQFVVGCKFINKARGEYCQGFDSLGIDPSRSSTGWALFRNKIKTGVIVPKSLGFSKAIHIGKKIGNILNQTNAFVGVEGYAYNSTWGREEAGELGGVIRSELYRYHRPLLLISPLTLKAWLKVKGKDQIMLEILDRYKIKISNNDTADAFVIADIIQKTLYLANHVVCSKISSEDVRLYLKDELYKESPNLEKLFKYQINSLFNIIWKNGAKCEFFQKVPSTL